MLKSRAITVTFRFYVGLAVFGVLAALAAAIGSSDDSLMNKVIGPLSVGWKGGIGDHLAYTVFLGLAVVSAGLAGLFTAFRDADPQAEAEIAHLEDVPLTRAPIGTSYWPVVGAFAVATTLIGLALSSRPLALAGAVAIGATALMWTVRAWAERATGSERANVELYQQVTEPFRLPLLALVLVAAMVISFSRLLLALPSTRASAVVFGLVALMVSAVVTVIALLPKLSRSVIALILFSYIGIFAYILTQGRGMAERNQARAQQASADLRTKDSELGKRFEASLSAPNPWKIQRSMRFFGDLMVPPDIPESTKLGR